MIKKFFNSLKPFFLKYIAFIILFLLGLLHLFGYIKFDWPVIVIFVLALFPAIAPLIKSLSVSKEGVSVEMAEGNATQEKINATQEEAGADNFSAFPLASQRVLKSLWHFQKKHYGPDHTSRWGFTVGADALNYKNFISGVVFLIGRNLAVTDIKQMVFLTKEGIDFCTKNEDEINKFPIYYEKFGSL